MASASSPIAFRSRGTLAPKRNRHDSPSTSVAPRERHDAVSSGGALRLLRSRPPSPRGPGSRREDRRDCLTSGRLGKAITKEMFATEYAKIFEGDRFWKT